MSKLIQCKLMISDVSSMFELVFGSNSNHHHTKKKNHNLVEIEFDNETSDDGIEVKFEKLKGGKTERRHKFTVSYPKEKIGQFKISITKHCSIRRQLIVVIEDFKLKTSSHLFIGKVGTEGKVYMMLMERSWSGLSLEKVNERLFDPTFSERNDRCILDQHSEGVMIHNPCVFLVHESSLFIRSLCDFAMGMFSPYNCLHSRFEPKMKKTRFGNILGVKGFSFTNSGSFSTMEVMFNNQNNDAFGQRLYGYCFKNGVYRYRKRDGKFQYLEFEECVELSMSHVTTNENLYEGIFLSHIYVRGKVREGKSYDEFKSNSNNFSSWKRLCILKDGKSKWITKHTIS